MPSIYSKVPLHCNNCGGIMMTDFRSYDGRFCCEECKTDYELKRAVSIIGGSWPQTEPTGEPQ